jgi:hypothetical protein
MMADTLLNWDKTELANILADKMADAEDLVEAFPSIEKASTIEEDILEDFIQSNWKLILSGFDVDELLEWIEEKDFEEEWERWRNECIEEDCEYAEYKNEEYCRALIDFFFSLRNMDLAEQRGYPSKFRKS